MSGEPTVIYSAASTQQAYLLKGLLEEQGIAARVVNDAIQLAGGELPLGWTAAARVVVPAADAASARQIAERFDHHATTPPSEIDALPTPETNWDAWPRCPACNQPRAARCPICGLFGTQFPLADIQESPAGQRVFLVCHACDDHFLPEWYRMCHNCGHDFGAGLSVDRPGWEGAFGARTWAVLVALLGAAAAFAAYFYWLFHWPPR